LAQEIFALFGKSVEEHPAGYCHLLTAAMYLVYPSREVVLVGDPRSEASRQMVQIMDHRLLPNTVRHVMSAENREKLAALAPFLADYRDVDGLPAAYVCESYACQAPVTEPEALESLLSPS
jgi:uncharacterized protein YyaL (SSP411 family)